MKKLLILIVIAMSMVACSDGLVVTNVYPGYYYYRPAPVYVRPPYRPMMPPPPRPRPYYRPNNNYRSYGNRTFSNRQPRFENRSQTRTGNSTGRFGSPRR